MSNWRDTASGDWIMYWGATDEFDWLQKELGMAADSYDQQSLTEMLPFVDPSYRQTCLLEVYDLRERATGRSERIVQGEISNGIWAVGYWRGSRP